MNADEMALLRHPPYGGLVPFDALARQEKRCLDPPLLKAVQKGLRISGIGAVVKGQSHGSGLLRSRPVPAAVLHHLSRAQGCGPFRPLSGQGSQEYSRQKKISRSRQEKDGRHFFQSLVHEKAPRAFLVSVYETAEAQYAPGSSRRAGWSSLRSSGRSLRHAPRTAWWAGIPAEAFRSAS